MLFTCNNKLKSCVFGYLSFNNYGDELLAKTLIDIYGLENYSLLSKKSSILKHIQQFSHAKQVFVIGGLFQDETSFLSLVYYLTVIMIFRILNKKIFLVSVGLGPIKLEVSKFLLYQVLKNIKNISVRDKYSKDLLMELGIKVLEDKDLVFYNKYQDFSNVFKKEKTLVCVRNENDWLLAKERFEFEQFDLLLMQQEFALAEQIQAETPFGIDVYDAFAFEYIEILNLVASYKKVISSRYHCAIFALQTNTDLCILEISPKLSSLKPMIIN